MTDKMAVTFKKVAKLDLRLDLEFWLGSFRHHLVTFPLVFTPVSTLTDPTLGEILIN